MGFKHYNPSITEFFRRIFNSKSGAEIPSMVGEIIVPTVEIQPDNNIVRDGLISATGASDIFTTPADKDFYLTSASLCVNKNATADDATGNIATLNVTIDGTIRSVLVLVGVTLTAILDSTSVVYSIPIKLDRGTNISIGGGAFTVGAKVRGATISGYTIETTAT